MATTTHSDTLNNIRALEPNWDGYDSEAILPSAIALARELVSLMEALLPEDARESLTISPVRHGGIQLDWSDAEQDHELGIEPDGSLEFLHTNKLTGELVERKYPSAGQAVHPGVLMELRAMRAAEAIER